MLAFLHCLFKAKDQRFVLDRVWFGYQLLGKTFVRAYDGSISVKTVLILDQRDLGLNPDALFQRCDAQMNLARTNGLCP